MSSNKIINNRRASRTPTNVYDPWTGRMLKGKKAEEELERVFKLWMERRKSWEREER